MRKNREMPLQDMLADPMFGLLFKSDRIDHHHVARICEEAQLGIRRRQKATA